METTMQPTHPTLSLPPLLLVVDLEATCDDAGGIPRAETEIIEIGAVLVDEPTLEPVDEFQTFVKPVRHPTLTRFCSELTTIGQADVASAPRFPEAIGNIARWLAGRRPLLCSWGDYDKNQLGRDASHHGITLPFGKDHLNVKRRFSEALGDPKRYGMAEALQRVGIPLAGTHHRGIDDARNIAKLLPWALGRRQAPTA
jgi:inhibitor of KinA sporulation pathway (predicted exonuclease)